MLEVLKARGQYPWRHVVCSCWRPGEGYWYLIEDAPVLSAMEPRDRGRHIVSRLPEKLQARVRHAGDNLQDAGRFRVCSMVNSLGMDLHWIDGVLDDDPPSAEATCGRLAELLGGDE